MALPAKIRETPTRPEKRLRSDSHLKWVRGHRCCVPGCEGMPIEAAHVRGSMDGGMGLKPGDDWTISLCADHHRWQHAIGEQRFADIAKIDLPALAQEFAAKSPKLRRKA